MSTRPIIYISVPCSTIGNIQTSGNVQETGINIVIDTIEPDMAFLLNFVRTVNFQFIISISDTVINDNNINDLLPGLYTLFTLSAGFGSSQNVLPVLVAAGNLLKNLEIVKDYFALQGETVTFPAIDPVTISIKDTILFTNTTQLAALDEVQLLEYSTRQPDQVILLTNTPVQWSEELARVKALKEQNRYVNAFLNGTALKNSHQVSLYQSALWQKRASLYLSFIALSKKVGEQEYYDIRNWYHNEYEVLPLWFKRLGHIVKVMTGKKSFKSLFPDKD